MALTITAFRLIGNVNGATAGAELAAALLLPVPVPTGAGLDVWLEQAASSSTAAAAAAAPHIDWTGAMNMTTPFLGIHGNLVRFRSTRPPPPSRHLRC